MAVVVQVPHNAAFLVVTGVIDWNIDTFKLILCTDFTFDVDTDIEYADIVNELPTGNGYINGGHSLAGGSVTIDDTNNDARRVFDTLILTASGGEIGPFEKVIIYDDTAVNKPIVACYTYAGSVVISDGLSQDFDIIPRFETPDSVT